LIAVRHLPYILVGASENVEVSFVYVLIFLYFWPAPQPLDKMHLGNTDLKQYSSAMTAFGLYAVALHKDRQVRLYCADNSISLL
ncbi:MAG: hypothetical protein IK084_02125, partial [Bacteroidaceae bacterium]|nr:hypothetical protein [Bacteroidaceae bacterium]